MQTMQAFRASHMPSAACSPLTLRRCRERAAATHQHSGSVSPIDSGLIDHLVLEARRAAAAAARKESLRAHNLIAAHGDIQLSVVEPNAGHAAVKEESITSTTETQAGLPCKKPARSVTNAGHAAVKEESITSTTETQAGLPCKKPARSVTWHTDLCAYASFYRTDAPLHVNTSRMPGRRLSLLDELSVRASELNTAYGSSHRSLSSSTTPAPRPTFTLGLFKASERAGRDHSTSPYTSPGYTQQQQTLINTASGRTASSSGARVKAGFNTSTSSTRSPSCAVPSVDENYRNHRNSLSTSAAHRAPRTLRKFVFNQSVLPRNESLVAKLAAQQVQLETLTIRAPHCFLTVRVTNIAPDKTVIIRRSSDKWKTHTDNEARYVKSVDGSDQFLSSVALKDHNESGSTEFCICYQVNGQEYWDNNGGQNYKLSVA